MWIKAPKKYADANLFGVLICCLLLTCSNSNQFGFGDSTFYLRPFLGLNNNLDIKYNFGQSDQE